MCAGFLILKLLNPHMFYIYDYHYHHWNMRFYMHASISVGYICDKWNVEYDSMHSILMIEDYVYIYGF